MNPEVKTSQLVVYDSIKQIIFIYEHYEDDRKKQGWPLRQLFDEGNQRAAVMKVEGRAGGSAVSRRSFKTH